MLIPEEPLLPLRDSYPSREALAPSSDLAFFFSFSRLSNPCGKGVISWTELCSPSSTSLPQQCPGWSAGLGGTTSSGCVSSYNKDNQQLLFLKRQLCAFLHSLLTSNKQPWDWVGGWDSH